MATKVSTLQKYKEIIGSPRFHQLVAITVLQIGAHYLFIDAYMANLLSTLLGASVTVGTVDSAAKKMSTK